MKAIICTRYGGPEALQLKEIEKPVPRDNEALIKVYASTVIAGDVRICRFNFAKWFWLPGRFIFGFVKPRRDIPGCEFSGEIEAVGKDVTRFKRGDKVFGLTKGISFGGTNAEYICLLDDRLTSFNLEKMSYQEAAVLPVGGLAALYFLREANVTNGYKVLIYGASGSVGTYAVQIAKYFGAEVTGVCSSSNFELVKTLGADYVIDYAKEDFTRNDKKYDVIFDAVIKTSFSKCKNSLTENGIYLTVDWPFLPALWASLTGKKRIIFGMAPDKNEDLIYLKELVEKNVIKPVIDKTFGLEEAVEAYGYVDKGHKIGNVALSTRH